MFSLFEGTPAKSNAGIVAGQANAPELSRGAIVNEHNQTAWGRRRLQLFVRRCAEHGLREELLARRILPVAWSPYIDGHWREPGCIRTDYRHAVTAANVSGIDGSHRHGGSRDARRDECWPPHSLRLKRECDAKHPPSHEFSWRSALQETSDKPELAQAPVHPPNAIAVELRPLF